jgi:hypothetical protein
MNTQAQHQEARRHSRHSVAVCAWLDFRCENTTRGTVSEDLSLEGARFSSMRPVAVGEPVLVRMQLDRSGGPIECKGRVCWSNSLPNKLHTFGVRFVDLSEDERNGLSTYFDKHLPTTAYAAV